MCAVAGLICSHGSTLPGGPEAAERIAAALAHRGPDDAGLWFDPAHPRAAIAHRRLTVIDPTPAGHQPMLLDDPATGKPRFVLSYNGELYNDAELRADLEREGARFRSGCDTETLLHALAHWGVGARARLRGMYAFALWDARERTLLLARDELGIKPLYYHAFDATALAFASEPAALFAHPGITPRPDWMVVSRYLSTIRISAEERTLFEGVSMIPPGLWLTIDASGPTLRAARHEPDWHTRPAPALGTKDLVADSVRRHLRADVPTCCLLSGGLDSSIISALALDTLPALDTYCAGAHDSAAPSADFAFASRVARHIGSRHTEAPITAPLFGERWRELVHRAGLPLCTPNEVAIHEVARTLRADGKVVTLSGEGADELFAGYAPTLTLTHRHIAGNPPETDATFGHTLATWIPAEQHALLLAEPYVADETRSDDLAPGFATDHAIATAEVARDFPGATEAERRLQAILRLQRRVNLANLLRRLDQSTMLASVEGRTPLADREIARFAESLPLSEKFVFSDDPSRVETKRTLRAAFADRLPAEVVARPKASFPLPFEGWMAPALPALDSAFAREALLPTARTELKERHAELWTIAWPVLNLALWGQRWWG